MTYRNYFELLKKVLDKHDLTDKAGQIYHCDVTGIPFDARALIFNPLTMNNDYSCHQNLAVCYQLVQSVLKIGSVLSERVGQGEWVSALLWLTVHGGCCSWL